jgi:hypothetical protein
VITTGFIGYLVAGLAEPWLQPGPHFSPVFC